MSALRPSAWKDACPQFVRSFGSPNSEDGGFFGWYATNVGGSQLLVAAPFENFKDGRAYLFDLDGQLLNTFESGEEGAEFGDRFLLSNEEAIFIGSTRDNSLGANGGAVYVYGRSEGFPLVQKFSNPTPSDRNCFGSDAAFIGDDRILISDRCDSLVVPAGGSAHLFDLDGDLVRSFYNPDPHPEDGFGASVAVAGDRLLLGATQDDNPETGLSAGAVFIFEQDGTQVARVDYPNPSGLENGGQWFGWNAGSYSFKGEEVFLVGSVFHSNGVTQETHRDGAVFVLDQDGKILQTLLSPDEGGQQFGASFAQYGDSLVIGEPMHNGGFPNGTGAAWIFTPEAVFERGDVNFDSLIDAHDIDRLSDAIVDMESDSVFDLSRDGLVDKKDRVTLVEEILGTHFGDVNLNKEVEFDDFLALAAGFGQEGGWQDGDIDGDAFVKFDDFLILASNFGLKGEAATASVPEPSLNLVLLMGVFAHSIRRGRQS